MLLAPVYLRPKTVQPAYPLHRCHPGYLPLVPEDKARVTGLEGNASETCKCK